MAKYRVIRDKCEECGYGRVGIIVSTFEAKNDLEAIFKVDEHCGYGYKDKAGKTYKEAEFMEPSIDDALNHLIFFNDWDDMVDGGGFIYAIKNLDTGNVIFEDDRCCCIEQEENW